MPKQPKIISRRKKPESVRERADKQMAKQEKTPRHSKMTSAAAKPVKSTGKVLLKEYHPIKLPNNKVGRVLTKRRSLAAGYLKSSFRELKLVEWPTFPKAISLSLAVIVFSVIIAGFVKILDYGFDKLFREVILR